MKEAETNARLETLEAHVARLEGIIDVLLEHIAAGNAQDVADDIRAELKKAADGMSLRPTPTRS